MLRIKTLKKLTILTVILSAPLIYLMMQHANANKQQLFQPGFLNKADQISKIIIQDSVQIITLQKEQGSWYVLERNRYPVISSNVDDLLYSLASLKIVEAKTSNKDYYQQLNVSDLSEPESQAVLISVIDKYNDVVLKMYVGKKEPVYSGENYDEHVFVRRANDAQTWLLQGTVSLSTQVRDWVEQPLLDILDTNEIKSVEIINDKSNIKIAKTSKADEDFSLKDIQQSKEMVLDLDTINAIPFEIAELEFNDVQIATNNLDGNKLIATLETFDGIKIQLEFYKTNDKILAHVFANHTVDASPEIQNKVDKFNAKKKGWLFELSPEIYQELSLNNDDFFKTKMLQ